MKKVTTIKAGAAKRILRDKKFAEESMRMFHQFTSVGAYMDMATGIFYPTPEAIEEQGFHITEVTEEWIQKLTFKEYKEYFRELKRFG